MFELLHSPEKKEVLKQIDIADRYYICLTLAKILNTIHSFQPPICHGHITSHNVFIDYAGKLKLNVKIGDLELTPLLKYANTFYDYKSASVWSPPECL